eukprot:GEZU01016454.1.p1 GENE.GEZU01016454.1~~GEZU01016454.1.p1  ORF type:complete len:275 (+),score=51.07 GEZU01016454.1:179-1003(+)
MKYLEVPEIAHFNSLLDGADVGDSIIYGKIEVYSCKKISAEKKLSKVIDQKLINGFSHTQSLPAGFNNSEELNNLILENTPPECRELPSVLSPMSPESPISVSPFGPLTSSSSRKTLINLISLLNASYPDYDFSNLKPEDFTKESSLDMVMNAINLSLTDVLPNEEKAKLWSTLNEQIKLKECDIYSYLPDPDSDPMGEEGKIWSWNYFFYNRKLKKVVFFTCYAVSCFHKSKSGDFGEMSDSENAMSDFDSTTSTMKNYDVHYTPRYADDMEY